jgi:hypothetical protein
MIASSINNNHLDKKNST